jgi:hypothetical protein
MTDKATVPAIPTASNPSRLDQRSSWLKRVGGFVLAFLSFRAIAPAIAD